MEIAKMDFEKSDGIILVDQYSGLKSKLTELKRQEEILKTKLIAYAKQFEIDKIPGSDKNCSVKEYEKIILPEGKDREEFIKLLKEKGLWDELSSINFMRLQSKVLKNEIDIDVKEKVKTEKAYRFGLSKKTE